MKTTTEQIAYIGPKKFVKFSNTKEFSDLSPATCDFLKRHGVLSDEINFPFMVSDGKLQRHKKDRNLVIIGKGVLDLPFCIDIANDERIVGFDPDGEIYVINSSIKRYIACNYVLRYYYNEIESKKIYGDYDKNHKKYAKKLREMFNEVEPGIEDFPAWEMEIFQKELGVL